MPKEPIKSIWQNKMPGFMKPVTRWFSRPNTVRGRVSNLMRWRFRGQWKCGEDRIGNEYYLYQPFPETPIRRFVIFRHGQTDMDNLPFLWYQWIRYQRNYPPTQTELDEYDQYLLDVAEKAAKIKERDDLERAQHPEFYAEQQKNFDQAQQDMTNKAQREVIALFASREKGLRIAAENKVEKMKQAQDIIQADRRHWTDSQYKEMVESYHDPKSVEPRDVEETVDPETQSADDIDSNAQQKHFKPGAWRPWQDDEDDEDEADKEDKDQQSQRQSEKR
mmetsp:Transcript_6520/g.10320  ORF Transcript_6520/g.10320 Transcript_6520/m.10320 type:complete len:277 (+) Transcript_6520:19-849(+)